MLVLYSYFAYVVFFCGNFLYGPTHAVFKTHMRYLTLCILCILECYLSSTYFFNLIYFFKKK